MLSISKGPYLLNVMNNASGISEKNHSYYNFGILAQENKL